MDEGLTSRSSPVRPQCRHITSSKVHRSTPAAVLGAFLIGFFAVFRPFRRLLVTLLGPETTAEAAEPVLAHSSLLIRWLVIFDGGLARDFGFSRLRSYTLNKMSFAMVRLGK